MCATLPDERVCAIMAASGMPRFTEATLTERNQFLRELERTRVQGFATDEAENQRAGRCIAVVIENVPFAAGVSISAPVDRIPRERVPDVVQQLQRLARTLSRKMQAG